MIISFFRLSLGWAHRWVSLRSEVLWGHRFVKHGRLVVDVQVTSFKVAAIVRENNRVINWTVISEAHLLDFISMVPEHIAVVSNKSCVIVILFMHDLFLFIDGFGDVKYGFDLGHSHRRPSEVLRIGLVALVKNNTVWIHGLGRFDLIMQLGDWVNIKVLLRNTWLGSNDLAVDVKRWHIMSQIDLRILHFSKLTLGLVSVPGRIPLVHCNLRVRSPNILILILNKFNRRRLHVMLCFLILFLLCILVFCIVNEIMILRNVFWGAGNRIVIFYWTQFLSRYLTSHVSLCLLFALPCRTLSRTILVKSAV